MSAELIGSTVRRVGQYVLERPLGDEGDVQPLVEALRGADSVPVRVDSDCVTAARPAARVDVCTQPTKIYAAAYVEEEEPEQGHEGGVEPDAPRVFRRRKRVVHVAATALPEEPAVSEPVPVARRESAPRTEIVSQPEPSAPIPRHAAEAVDWESGPLPRGRRAGRWPGLSVLLIIGLAASLMAATATAFVARSVGVSASAAPTEPPGLAHR